MTTGIKPNKGPIIGLATQMDPWIREEALARGWRLLNLLHVGNRGLPEIKTSGVISESPLSPEVLALHRQGIPVVRVGELFDESLAHIPAVLFDVTEEGKQAADHYYERGFHDVGFFAMDPWGDGRLLFEGFRARAEELGMDCHLFQLKLKQRVTHRGQRLVEKQHGFIDWVKTLPKPLGVLCKHSWFSACYCSWAEQGGFTVPDEVAVISTECDSGICECSTPSITTVDRDHEKYSRKACEILAQIMQGTSVRNPSWITPKTITARESTNILAGDDRDVAKRQK